MMPNKVQAHRCIQNSGVEARVTRTQYLKQRFCETCMLNTVIKTAV